MPFCLQQEREGANSMEQISATLVQIQPTTKLILLLDKDDPCCPKQLLTQNISGYFIKDNIDASLPHLVRAIVAGQVIYSCGVCRRSSLQMTHCRLITQRLA